MALDEFSVVHEHNEPLNRVLVHCFDGRQLVLVLIPREAIDDYFERSDLTPKQRNLLIDRNLATLIPVITAKYERGEVGYYAGYGAQHFPRVDLSLADLRPAPEKMTDTVLGMADH